MFTDRFLPIFAEEYEVETTGRRAAQTMKFIQHTIPQISVMAAQALVPGRSNPLGTTTEFRSRTFEEYGAPCGSSKGDAHCCSVRYRRGGIPVY